MRQQTVTKRRGFTLTEVLLVILIAPMVVMSMGLLLVDSHRGWNQTYLHFTNGVANDAYMASKTFDAVVRKSSRSRELLGDGEVELYFYNDPLNSIWLDKYAKFYTSDTDLLVDYGQLDSNGNYTGQTQTITLAHNVTSINFYVMNACVQMVLILDNGSESLTVTANSIRYNE